MAGQVFGARMSETMSETNKNKLLFCRDSEAAFRRVWQRKCNQRIRLGKAVAGSGVRGVRSGVQPEAARFEPALDWGKLWRGQVFGELEATFGSESTL